MNTPQSAIIPEHSQAAIYIEANVQPEYVDDFKQHCQKAVEVLQAMQQQFPQSQLGMTIAFGATFWQSLQHQEGQDIKPFTALGNGLCPATQCDVMIHIQSLQHNINFALAQLVLDIFADTLNVQHEQHGFRLLEERGVEGFVDGTENPHGDDNIAQVAIDQHGGSYVVLQKYLHDLKKWNKISIQEQENAIGRSKADNIEFSRDVRLPNSHLGRTNIKENGVGLKIVRRSLPFGTVSGEHGLMFIAYCAKLHHIEQQLLMMFGEVDGQTDLLLQHLSQAVRSAYYYAPSLERLMNL